MSEILRPATEAELGEAIAAAAASRTPLEILGGGSKLAIGAPRRATLLDMGAFAGVADYDPAELVLTARAGTKLADLEALVAHEGQMLAFEPWDYGALSGLPPASTIGGVLAAGVAGPRRLSAGGARDHLLGLRAVSGRGELFAAGGKVVKNVTGYDLPKLLAGSWGRLAALTEVTLKTLPRPRLEVTMAIDGLAPAQAQAAMARALGSEADIAAAAHLPGPPARTGLRLHGFAPSVEARCAALPALLANLGLPRRLPPAEAEDFWAAVRQAAPLREAPILWRVSLPPAAAAPLLAELTPLGARHVMDWGGALLWLAFEGAPSQVRRLAEAAGGHAMLARAPETLRASVPALHPAVPALAALEARVRRAFDPAGIFETGRFAEPADAN